jgi:hypothetical protein
LNSNISESMVGFASRNFMSADNEQYSTLDQDPFLIPQFMCPNKNKTTAKKINTHTHQRSSEQ